MVNLGVDVGGTGCKCVAFSEDGRQLAAAYEEYPLKPGAAWLSPQVLTDSVFRVIRQCAAVVQEVAAITVSSFGESFVPLDKDGVPLTDIMLYYADGTNEAFDTLVRTVGEEPFVRIAKLVPQTTYSLAQMLRTKDADKFLFVAGYLAWRLSGVMATDPSLAGRSLLYDVEHGCWSDSLVEACGFHKTQLPELRPAGSVLGTLLPSVARALGLPETVQVVLGVHDQIAAALGSGVRQAGEAVDTSGTCECLTPMFSHIPGEEFTRSNFACVAYPGGYVTYAYNISAGSVVRWYRDTFGQSYSRMNETCTKEPTGLIFLPFLQGMGGTPDVDPKATGVWIGLTTETSMPQMYRAVLEGITYELRYNMELLARSGVQIRKLYAAGGGARSAAWLQIKADILGCPVIPVCSEETGAMGSAMLGFSAVTGTDPGKLAEQFCRYAAPVVPKEEHRQQYEIYYKDYVNYRKLFYGKETSCRS